eukprot:COSAG02_NODE_3915_length_6050_cov_22.279281_2_plen_131_part_00
MYTLSWAVLVVLELNSCLLFVVHQRLVFPWDFLILVEQYPFVVACAQTAYVGPNIACRVALGEQIATRLWWAAVRWKTNLLTGLQVVNHTTCRSERLWRLGADAAYQTLCSEAFKYNVSKPSRSSGIDMY